MREESFKTVLSSASWLPFDKNQVEAEMVMGEGAWIGYYVCNIVKDYVKKTLNEEETGMLIKYA